MGCLISIGMIVSQLTRGRKICAILCILHRCLHRLSSVTQTPELMAATIAIPPGRRVYQLQQPCVMKHRSLHRLRYQSPAVPWTKRHQSSTTGVEAVGEVTPTTHTGRNPTEPAERDYEPELTLGLPMRLPCLLLLDRIMSHFFFMPPTLPLLLPLSLPQPRPLDLFLSLP